MFESSRWNIRNFRWKDLDSLVRVRNADSKSSGPSEAADKEYLYQLLSQPSCEAEQDCLVADYKGTIIGYSIVSRELRIGRTVATGGVLEKYRNQGIGRSLLSYIIQYTASVKAEVLHIEIPEDNDAACHILKSTGFEHVKTYHKMNWADSNLPQVALPTGFKLRSFILGEDEGKLTCIQNEAFQDNWGFCPNSEDDIHARVRFNHCDPNGILFAETGNQFAAYNWTEIKSVSGKITGRISMTGVHPGFRKRGLGKKMLVAGMTYLSANGASNIELEVDSENLPATKMYSSLGFETLSQGLWYEKDLLSVTF